MNLSRFKSFYKATINDKLDDNLYYNPLVTLNTYSFTLRGIYEYLNILLQHQVFIHIYHSLKGKNETR